jgi:mono/diheme cytochrome c family protein
MAEPFKGEGFSMPRLVLLVMLGGAAGAWAQAPDGAALYGQHCATCHQADGSGTPGLAPAIKGEHWQRLGADRNYLPMVMLHGLAGPIRVNGQPFVGAMPGLAGQLDDAALAAIANQVRRLQGAAADKAYSAEELRAVRSAGGNPPATRALRVKLVGA